MDGDALFRAAQLGNWTQQVEAAQHRNGQLPRSSSVGSRNMIALRVPHVNLPMFHSRFRSAVTADHATGRYLSDLETSNLNFAEMIAVLGSEITFVFTSWDALDAFAIRFRNQYMTNSTQPNLRVEIVMFEGGDGVVGAQYDGEAADTHFGYWMAVIMKHDILGKAGNCPVEIVLQRPWLDFVSMSPHMARLRNSRKSCALWIDTLIWKRALGLNFRNEVERTQSAFRGENPQ